MSDFKAKMHQIRFRLGLQPDPAGGAYSAPPDPLTGFKGAYFYGRGREGRGGERRGGGGKERGGEALGSAPYTISGYATVFNSVYKGIQNVKKVKLATWYSAVYNRF